MTAIDNAVLERYREAKATRHEKIDLSKLPVGAKIKVISEVAAISYFLEMTIPREGKARVICDRSDHTEDLGERLLYSFSPGSHIPSRSEIEKGNQLWFDTVRCLWIEELFLLG